MAANTFRLGVRPSAHYRAMFDAQPTLIKPAWAYRNRAFPPLGVITITEGELEFEVHMPVSDDGVDERHLDVARSVMNQIVEMDDQARALKDIIDSDETLAWVKVTDDAVDLHYFATTVNSEWDVRFRADASGRWLCQGIPKHPQH